MNPLVLLFSVSFISLSAHFVRVLGEESAAPETPDFEQSFLTNAYYLVDCGKRRNPPWCGRVTLPDSKQKLTIQYVNGPSGSTYGTADVQFYSLNGSEPHNLANVSNAEPEGLKWLETKESPYQLLFADSQKCMVISFPQMTSTEPTEVEAREEKTGYCIMLRREYFDHDVDSRRKCERYYKSHCKQYRARGGKKKSNA